MAYAVAHAGATKIRPVIVDVAAAKGLVPFVQQAAKLFPSATLLSPVYVPAQATDVTSQAAAASANGADGAFFVVGGGAAATLTRALRTAGFTGTLAAEHPEHHPAGDQGPGSARPLACSSSAPCRPPATPRTPR